MATRDGMSEWARSLNNGHRYCSKADLMEFCRSEGLSTSGSKSDLVQRIQVYALTGERAPPVSTKRHRRTEPITLDSVIEEGIVCSEMHRDFFRTEICDGFKFTVPFMEWLRSNSGKKYSDAVAAYWDLKESPRTCKIAPQFQYNTYVRDFLADNPGKTLKDAAACWNHVRDSEGPFVYSRFDLRYLDDI
jgi:hypothetical protein